MTHKVAAVHINTVNRVTLVRDGKGIRILYTFLEAVTFIKSGKKGTELEIIVH